MGVLHRDIKPEKCVALASLLFSLPLSPLITHSLAHSGPSRRALYCAWLALLPHSYPPPSHPVCSFLLSTNGPDAIIKLADFGAHVDRKGRARVKSVLAA